MNLNGTLENAGTTLVMGAAETWRLNGGRINGGTVAGEAGSQLLVTSLDGTLEGVTLDGDATLQTGAQVTVLGRIGLKLHVSRLNLSKTRSSSLRIPSFSLNRA